MKHSGVSEISLIAGTLDYIETNDIMFYSLSIDKGQSWRKGHKRAQGGGFNSHLRK